MQYSVKYSKRRTLAIEIKRAQVIVRAPIGTAQHIIDDFIRCKASWIKRHLLTQERALEAQSNPFELGHVMLFAQQTPIFVGQGVKSTVVFDGKEIHIDVGHRVRNPELKQRQLLEGFLKQQLEHYLSHRIAFYSEKMAISFKSWKVRSYKRRWGSCTACKELSFNLFLAQAPQWVVDSVIIHELAHCKQLNHGAKFWQLVDRFDTNRNQASAWLKQHASQLHWCFD